MAIAAKVPRSMIAKKPPHGAPCNQCGTCCYATLCGLGRHIFNRTMGPCPALIQPDQPGGKASCGLLGVPGDLGEAARYLIGTGVGCDARFNNEPRNLDFYDRCEQWDHDNKKKIAWAEKLWGLT